jgi:hypothetical protein
MVAAGEGMRRWIALAVTALLLGGCSVAGNLGATHCPASRKLLAQGAADYIDFVHVGGITYHAGMRPMAGRALRESDLGTQVAVVRCKLAEHMVEGPDKQHLDGDAAYLDKGTALYAVKGYRPTFRLAARRDDQLALFQAAENPRAQHWADLLDLRDKVRWIGINDDDDQQLAAIKDPPMVASLVDLLLRSPVSAPSACADQGNVLLAFRLDDGTATVLSYHLGDRRLDCRNPLPAAFGSAIRTALR